MLNILSQVEPEAPTSAALAFCFWLEILDRIRFGTLQPQTVLSSLNTDYQNSALGKTYNVHAKLIWKKEHVFQKGNHYQNSSFGQMTLEIDLEIVVVFVVPKWGS